MIVNVPKGVTAKSLLKTGKTKTNIPTDRPVKKQSPNNVPAHLKRKGTARA